MKYFLLLVFGCCLLTSVSAQKTSRVKKVKQKESVKEQIVNPTALVIDSINVSIYITHHYPYCGGAYPDESEMNNYQPLANTNFVLINFTTNTETIVKSDSTGTLKLNLAPGKYGIKETYKNIPFEEFYEKYYVEGNDQTQAEGKECYRSWWSGLLSEFVIVDSATKIKSDCTIYDACFTGINPCLNYFGSWPP